MVRQKSRLSLSCIVLQSISAKSSTLESALSSRALQVIILLGIKSSVSLYTIPTSFLIRTGGLVSSGGLVSAGSGVGLATAFHSYLESLGKIFCSLSFASQMEASAGSSSSVPKKA